MKAKYLNKIPDKNSFYRLFETTGWNQEEKKSKDELYSAIQKSWFNISVYDEDNLIGFGRIISDGFLHAFIVDLIVEPDYQRCGIGTKLLNCLVDRLKQNGINDIQLFCAKGKKQFYLKNNFVDRPNDAPGMEYNNKRV
ncbi:MAG: GNAT family N-acetyltransferase [Prevotellaceae bacterium]|jgi:ribosomal protein S18 acetylase RimI-like enzyme|nr:GNAT family N-acetyltransferase [Prevotellaceae bacterium]